MEILWSCSFRCGLCDFLDQIAQEAFDAHNDPPLVLCWPPHHFFQRPWWTPRHIGHHSGAQWPLLFAIISERFSALSTTLHCVTLVRVASPIGSYFLNLRVAGYLYDVEAEKQNNA